MRRILSMLALAAWTFLCPAAGGPVSTWTGPSRDISAYGRLAFRTFTDQDGLPQNGIWALAVDHDGCLWAGTPGGLARYNGSRWTAFDLPSGAGAFWVNQGATAFTSDGGLWFGTRRAGAFCWKGGRWIRESRAEGLPGDNVNAILESRWPDASGRRRLWMATYDGGLAFRDDRVWHPVGGLPTHRLFCLAETRQGNDSPVLWVGTDQGLYCFQDGRWRPFEQNQVLQDKQVRCLAVMGEGDEQTLWIGTDEHGLGEWRRGHFTFHHPAPGGLPSGHVLALLPTRTPKGHPALWVGTQGGGLAQVEDGRWRVLDRGSGLPSNLVRSLAESITPDGQRTLWIGTDGKGVARLVEGGWAALRTPWESADPRAQDFLETVDSRGTPSYWMGGLTWGLARFKEGVWTRWEQGSGLPDNRVRCLWAPPGPQDRDDLWLGGNSGVCHFEGGRWTLYREKDGLPSDTIRALEGWGGTPGHPVVWAGTSMGLAKIEDGRITAYSRKDGLPDNSIRALLADGPRLWIGTDSGIARFEGGRFTSYGLESGLSSLAIACLHLERNGPGGEVLWAGTYGGGVDRIRLTPSGLEVKALGEHTTPAIPSDVVDAVEQDATGRVYLFTHRGVARLRPGPGSEGGIQVETFALEDGLPGLECMPGASLLDHRGRLWTSTVDGMAILDPGQEFVDRSPKRLRLEAVTLDGRPLPLDSGQRIPGRNRALAFDYTLLSFHREGETRFRTQLVGLEDRPTDWTPDAHREFPHVPAGSYTFQVWGRDFAGNVSGPVNFSFSIPPSPWATWWAIALYVLAGLAGLDLIARWRHRLLERRTHELEAKVAERTQEVMNQAARLEALNQDLMRLNLEKNEFMGIAAHDLRNPLSNITMLSEALSEAEELFTPEERRERLQQVAQKAHEMAEILSKLLDVNAIEAGRLDLTFATFDLLPVVEEVIEDYQARARAKGIVLHLQHDQSALQVHAASLQVKQVLENLVSNAVKYSPPNRGVWIALAELPQAVLLKVRDEGAGLTDSDRHKIFKRFTKLSARPTGGEASTGLGLSIARRLVEAMHGRIWVESEEGRGSTFCVELPKPV